MQIRSLKNEISKKWNCLTNIDDEHKGIMSHCIYLECDHGGLAIVMVLTYDLRFIKTSQPKFQRASPSSSRIMAILKMCKMQTHYFTDQNLNSYSSGLTCWNRTKFGTLIFLMKVMFIPGFLTFLTFIMVD